MITGLVDLYRHTVTEQFCLCNKGDYLKHKHCLDTRLLVEHNMLTLTLQERSCNSTSVTQSELVFQSNVAGTQAKILCSTDTMVPGDARGYYKVSTGSAPVRIAMHRLVSWLAHGPPANPSMECLHACTHKDCCRPECLHWGTHQEYMATAKKKRRR